MERVKGIEPSYEAWEAAVLPLNYTRHAGKSKRSDGADVAVAGRGDERPHRTSAAVAAQV